jgi:hypothetical protein
MQTPPGSAAFYVVLIAPGFVAVMTAISLAAIEDEIKQFVLLIWSLVLSLIIDTFLITVYDWLVAPVTSINQLRQILFEPSFRADCVAIVLATSVVVGMIYAAGVLVDVPGVIRKKFQSKMQVKYSTSQPWEEILKEADQVKVNTTDDQIFVGHVVGWSRAGREKELRLKHVEGYNPNKREMEDLHGDELFLQGSNIQRITVLRQYRFFSIRERISNTISR